MLRIIVRPMCQRAQVSVHYQLREIFAQDMFGPRQLFGRVLLHFGQLVFPAQRLVLVYAQAVVWQQLDALNLLVVPEVFTQAAQIFFKIAQARHQHIAQPEGVVVLL